MLEKAEDWKKKIVKTQSFPAEHFQLIPGDITKENLGMDARIQPILQQSVTHVFHLAAIYDLAVPIEIAYRVNIEGTKNVNNWVRSLENLERYIYFSTAYVAGKREGTLYEHELIRPHAFKKHYEETKYEAEVFVDELKKEILLTIIRPGIVKGHSKTGKTTKFDGPYFIFNMIDRLRFLPFFPKISNSNALVNLVPIDFIVNAVIYLSHAKVGEGKTYHLTDPNPYRVEDIYGMIVKEMLGKKLVGRLPLSLLRFSLAFSFIRKFLKVEKEVLDYFTWMGHFDCSEAQKDLQEAGISCPNLKE